MQERRGTGPTFAQVSRELGVRADLRCQWEQVQGRAQVRTMVASGSEAAEQRRVRRELETLRPERAFLKRAAIAFFERRRPERPQRSRPCRGRLRPQHATTQVAGLAHPCPSAQRTLAIPAVDNGCDDRLNSGSTRVRCIKRRGARWVRSRA